LNFFASVRDDASACAAALRSSERVIVQDVRESKLFAGQPSKDVLIDAGVRGVTATPLIASTGNLLGMISMHFATPHRPSERELNLIDILARQTADYLEGKRANARPFHVSLKTRYESSSAWRLRSTTQLTSFIAERRMMMALAADRAKAFNAAIVALLGLCGDGK
jgi:GAF domain-containing protein